MISLLPRLSRSAAVLATVMAALPAIPVGAWEQFPGSVLVEAEHNDGDSFLVRLPGKQEEVVRLYYVDCPETTLSAESDRRRALEQARHFGLEDPPRVIEFGREATAFVAAALREPFTVHTVFARAPGRSLKPRIYAMIETSGGEDLAQLLVERGLARARGIGRALPNGTPASEYAAYLGDLEMAAAMKKAGVWSATDTAKLAEMRRAQRDEERLLNEALKFGVFSTLSEDSPLDLNEASAEELQQLQGIGPELAERIVEGRPYRSKEELLRVRGIGPATLERIAEFVRAGEDES